MVKFYQKNNPEKIPLVDQTLEAYRGREQLLFKQLQEQYANRKKRFGRKKPAFDDPEDGIYPSVLAGLKQLYRKALKPVEQTYLFHEFFHPLLRDSDFDAAPILLLCGQYSTGKTSFIKYLLQRDFPGIRIGPEPTTDRFVAVMHGLDERIIPGNALVMQTERPFTALTKFGSAFLNKLECAQMKSKLLEKLTIVDTPGVLAGEKQRMGRSYDYTSVMEWFAERSDRILLLFDAHKLDISDEFKRCLLALKGNDDKIRVVLNKADAVPTQALMRVYGAMMWSLGKVINTPEVMRVYIGSFWDQPIKNEQLLQLFTNEMQDLVSDLKSVPRNGVLRKINELVKRARMAKVHSYIISHMREQMPFMGKKRKQQQMIQNLEDVFYDVKRKYDLVLGDFPDVDKFREKLQTYDDFSKSFKKYNKRVISELETALEKHVPKLMKQLPAVHRKQREEAAAATAPAANPFQNPMEGAASTSRNGWAVSAAQKSEFDNLFETLQGAGSGKVSGGIVAPELRKQGPNLTELELRQVWSLSDCDGDGHLSSEEFAVAMYLIRMRIRGDALPSALPQNLKPPSQRDF